MSYESKVKMGSVKKSSEHASNIMREAGGSEKMSSSSMNLLRPNGHKIHKSSQKVGLWPN